MPLAAPQDVEARLGRDLAADETEQVRALLADAETVIRARMPDLSERIDSGRITVDVVIMVEANMVLRVLRNPTGIRSQSAEGYSVEYDKAVASGALWVTAAEWRMLGKISGVFALQPSLPPVETGPCIFPFRSR